MSQLTEVLKNKNKLQKLIKERRKSEMIKLQEVTAFRARLYEELKKIDMLFDSDKVASVKIRVPEKLLSVFTDTIYSGDLVGYDISQVDGSSTDFIIEKKIIHL